MRFCLEDISKHPIIQLLIYNTLVWYVRLVRKKGNNMYTKSPEIIMKNASLMKGGESVRERDESER